MKLTTAPLQLPVTNIHEGSADAFVQFVVTTCTFPAYALSPHEVSDQALCRAETRRAEGSNLLTSTEKFRFPVVLC
jgi:hypothetical protein